MRGAFEGHFSWQAQYLVNLDDIVKGSKSHFVKLSSNMMIPCGAALLALIFRGRRSTL